MVDNVINNHDIIYIHFGNLYFSRAVSFTASNVSVSMFVPTLDQSPNDRVPFIIQKSSMSKDVDWDIGTMYKMNDPIVVGDFFALWALDEGLPPRTRYLVPCDNFKTYTYSAKTTRLTFADNFTEFGRFWSIMPVGNNCSGQPLVSGKSYTLYSATDFRQVMGRNFNSPVVELENSLSVSTDGDLNMISCDKNLQENNTLRFEKINLKNE